MNLIARWKFRFDLGQSFLAVINLGLIATAASGSISTATGIRPAVIICVLVPGSLLSVLLFGYLLDRCSFFERYQDELNRRNTMLSEIHKRNDSKQ